MFPSGNNRPPPFPSNMMGGPPFRYNQPPPPNLGTRMMPPNPPMNIPTYLPPPRFPVPAPGYGVSSVNQSSTYSTPVYSAPPRLSVPTPRPVPVAGNVRQNQSQFGNVSSKPANVNPSQGQSKDNVARMTIDFIKKFQDQVSKRQVVEEKRNRMKVQSKASEQDQTERSDSPFSDVSDSTLAPLADVSEPGLYRPSRSSIPAKGILKTSTKTTSQSEPRVLYQQGVARKDSPTVTSQAPSKSTATHTSGSSIKTSDALKSILKNYDEPSTSSVYRKSSESRPWRPRSSSPDMYRRRDADRRTRPDSGETRDSDRRTRPASGETRDSDRWTRPDSGETRDSDRWTRLECGETRDSDRRSRPNSGGNESRGHFVSSMTSRDDRKSSRSRTDTNKSEGLQDISDDDNDDLDIDSVHIQSQVFIGNLPEDVIESDIYVYLVDYPVDVWLGYHKKDRRDICAFVKLPSMKESKKLINTIRDDKYKGRRLDVRFTAALDFTDFKVRLYKQDRRQDREEMYDSPPSVHPPAGSHQVIYTQVPQYIGGNPGDPYSMPVYFMPQPTQQLFIPYNMEEYGGPSQPQVNYYNTDYSPAIERRPEKCKVYMGNLPSNISMASLEAFLMRHNYSSLDLKSRDGKTFAFVEFDCLDEAENMVRDCDNKTCYGRNLIVRLENPEQKLHWREKERQDEKERQNKSLFQKYVESAFSNAPLLGKKYVTEYLSVRDNRATYVCSVCVEMCCDSDVAEHVVGYRHRLKCFRKDQPEIYDKMCRIRDKSTMVIECARSAADNEILGEKITVQLCVDPDNRAKRHLENIKDASHAGGSRSKSKESSQEKENSSRSSGVDIFKKIAMMKQKFEDSKKDDEKSGVGRKPGSSSDSSKLTLADSIVAELTSKQQEEDEFKAAEQTEMETRKEEESLRKEMELKRREDDMKRRLEEAKQKVIDNQKKMEEERKRKEEEKKAEEDRLRKAEEDRLRKLEEERIKVEKRQLEEQKRKLEQEKKLLEQKKFQAAQKQALEMARIKALDAARLKEEEIRIAEEKKREEEKKVEEMLSMLEKQKREEDVRKLEEQRKQEEYKFQLLLLQQEEMKKQERLRQVDEMKKKELLRQQQEKLKWQEELKRQEAIKQQQEAIKQQEEQKYWAERKRIEDRRLAEQRIEDAKKRMELQVREQQQREVEEIKKRHMHLQRIQEMEEKRQKELRAAQRRQAAQQRVELMKNSGDPKTASEDLGSLSGPDFMDDYTGGMPAKQKVEEIRQKTYMALPFSMAEKKKDLLKNIGPDEKLGPQEYSNVDSVLALKYDMKGAPLIGLEYIVEACNGTQDKLISHYFCECCFMESKNTDAILQHLVGFTHRSRYLEVHKPELYAEIMSKDLRRGVLSELLKKEAITIEKETGRFQIPTIMLTEFKFYVKKFKLIESNYKEPAPDNNIRQVVAQSEKSDWTPTSSCYDPTLNVQGILNRTLSMACGITYQQGLGWVEFYKFVGEKRLANDPMLGLQYITEVRGNKTYAPKYICSLCDVMGMKSPQITYSHLQSIPHLEKYLNLVHPEKIQGNGRLSARGLSKVEQNKIIRDIAYETGAAQKEKESIKVGVLLLENVWRAWHEQGNPQADRFNEYEDCTTAKSLKLRPQIYDVLKQCEGPICGLGSLTEIQHDSLMTYYNCQLCEFKPDTSLKLSQKNIIEHLTGRKHKRLYMKMQGLDGNQTHGEIDEFLRNRKIPEDEAIVVKKVLYLDLQGRVVYSDPEVMRDPNRVREEESSQCTVQSSQHTAQSSKPEAMDKDVDVTKDPPNVKTESRQTTQIPDVPKPVSQQNKEIEPRRPTRFDKIVKGLDYTPLLGLEHLMEIQHMKEDVQPRFECKLCGLTGRRAELNPKNILRHIGTKGHRISYLKKKHPSMFLSIKSLIGIDKESRLNECTKEIGAKFKRGEINVRVETDPMFWSKEGNGTQQDVDDDDDDDVIITKVEIKETDEQGESMPAHNSNKQIAESSVEEKKNAETDKPATKESPPSPAKEPPLNLDQLIANRDSDTEKWKLENEWIQEHVESGQLVASGRCSRFIADYSTSFCTYPLTGLQWITEFQKEGSTNTKGWWCVCRLCEEKVENWRYISNHVSSIKHRLRYMQKKYPDIYTHLKRQQFTAKTENLLRQRVYKHAQDIMKTEGKEFKPEVMLQKSSKPSEGNPIPTVSTGALPGPGQSPRIPKKAFSNLRVINPTSSSSSNTNKSSTLKRGKTTDAQSVIPSKKLKTGSPDVKQPYSTTVSGDSMSKATESGPETEFKSGVRTKGELVKVKPDKKKGEEMKDVSQREDTNTGTVTEEKVTVIPRKLKPEENTAIKNLKRKVTEEPGIQTKTPYLRGELIDLDEADNFVKIKRSKMEHKGRRYRDSYGSSYGQELERKRESGKSSRGRSGSRHRSPKDRLRDRDRSGRSRSRGRDRSGRSRERDRSRKSPTRDKDRSRSKRSRNEDQYKKKETKEEEQEQEDHNAESVESDADNEDFDFIMAQLGDDFITVDEVEDGDEDFVTLDEVVDEKNGHSDNYADAGLGTVKEAKQLSQQDSKETVDENEKSTDLKSSEICEVKSVSESVSDKNRDLAGQVSVVIEEQKMKEKSDKVTDKADDQRLTRTSSKIDNRVTDQADALRMTRSSSKVESQNSKGSKKQEVTVKMVDEGSSMVKSSVCPFLGIPIAPSTSTSISQGNQSSNNQGNQTSVDRHKQSHESVDLSNWRNKTEVVIEIDTGEDTKSSSIPELNVHGGFITIDIAGEHDSSPKYEKTEKKSSENLSFVEEVETHSGPKHDKNEKKSSKVSVQTGVAKEMAFTSNKDRTENKPIVSGEKQVSETGTEEEVPTGITIVVDESIRDKNAEPTRTSAVKEVTGGQSGQSVERIGQSVSTESLDNHTAGSASVERGDSSNISEGKEVTVNNTIDKEISIKSKPSVGLKVESDKSDAVGDSAISSKPSVGLKPERETRPDVVDTAESVQEEEIAITCIPSVGDPKVEPWKRSSVGGPKVESWKRPSRYPSRNVPVYNRQTHAYRPGMVTMTMEMGETSPDKAEQARKEEKEVKRNEIEVSIEIG